MSGITWLALEPVTGRTHQLRVHCAAMGWPIVGDNIYGNAPRFEGPIMHLHAREIVIPISKNKPPVRVTAPVPLHMVERLKACGWTAKINSFVIAGLDPAIHLAPKKFFQKKMDPRVKPAGDGR